MRRDERPRFLWAAPAVLWAAGIWWLSSNPSPPGSSWLKIPHLDKVAHFGLFFVQALLLRLAGVNAPLAFLAALTWGGIDEVHQRFVPGRAAELGDWMADAVGAAAGILAWRLIRLARRLD